jgi:HAD superfamily hydrolase (TIGR01549 family)
MSITETKAADYAHITTLIFDMDGTLIEHTWQLSQITETLFARFAAELAPVTHDQFFETFWSKNMDMWYMMVDGVIDGETAAKYSYINTLRALEKEVSLGESMLAYWHSLVLEEAKPFADTFNVLRALQNHYTTGILTNGFTALQRDKINKYNLADYVDFTLISEEAGFHKPDRRIFLKALEMSGDASSHESLYVGDNLMSDIQGAKAAGLTPIFINPNNDLDPPAGIVKIQRLSELLTLLGRDSQ